MFEVVVQDGSFYAKAQSIHSHLTNIQRHHQPKAYFYRKICPPPDAHCPPPLYFWCDKHNGRNIIEEVHIQ